ncbi:MAG: hypothetical protein PPP58_05610 [Natronomonas sp.]
MDSLTDLDIDVTDVTRVTERRDEIIEAIRDHAGSIAYNLARVQGGDYGKRSFSTDRGNWTVKHEAGELGYLRYEPQGGGEVYVVSTQRPAEPEPLARALTDYPAFVERYNAYVESLDGMLDEVETAFPDVATSDAVVEERDQIVREIEACCRRMAAGLYRHEGTDYGTFSARVDGTRWELKRDEDSVSYLRAGGSGGVYLLSQYGQPSATDVREYAPRFGGFVAAYNDHVAELELDLATIELS